MLNCTLFCLFHFVFRFDVILYFGYAFAALTFGVLYVRWTLDEDGMLLECLLKLPWWTSKYRDWAFKVSNQSKEHQQQLWIYYREYGRFRSYGYWRCLILASYRCWLQRVHDADEFNLIGVHNYWAIRLPGKQKDGHQIDDLATDTTPR